MSGMIPRCLCSCVLVIVGLCGAVEGELCYIDNSTGTGVYCEPNCCGNNPTYCCDKETFIINCAVFGSLGVVFIVCMILCCVCKKVKKDKKKKEAAAAAQGTRKVPPVSTLDAPVPISVISPGGVVNQGFNDQPGENGSGSHPTLGPSAEHGFPLKHSPAYVPLSPYSTLADPPSSGPMYSQVDYPLPATPTLPVASPVHPNSMDTGD